MNAIDDETRPVTTWPAYANVRDFISDQANDFLKFYWRDLMRSQPNHIELLVEKNTVYPIVEPIAQEFTIPITSGRGYSSLPPRIKMAHRFSKSGKEKLVLVILSDLDPDGVEIAQSFARSMRDDFGIEDIHPIRAGLTPEQIEQLDDPPTSLEAKKTSAQYKKFVEQYGTAAYELEALPPERLQSIVQETLDSIIDWEMFNRERDQEREDAVHLQATRKQIQGMLIDAELE